MVIEVSASNFGQSERSPSPRGFPNTEKNVRETVCVGGQEEGRLEGGCWRLGEGLIEGALTWRELRQPMVSRFLQLSSELYQKARDGRGGTGTREG